MLIPWHMAYTLVLGAHISSLLFPHFAISHLEMVSPYQPWTSQYYRHWDASSSVPQFAYEKYCTTFLYFIWPSEEVLNSQGNKFRVTCVLYQPISGSYFENLYVGNDDDTCSERIRRSFSIYRYMKIQMSRNRNKAFHSYRHGR